MSRTPSIQLDTPGPTPLALVVVTERPPVYEFFGALGVPAWRLDVDAELIEQKGTAIAGASVCVVDFALHPLAAVDTCRALRSHDGRLPLAAVICCPHSVTPQNIRALAGAGVTTILDLQMTREDTLRALRATRRGEAVLHLSFGGWRRATLADVIGGRRLRGEDNPRLLELVAQGLTDNDIGARLHLSPHTVKKRIEYLRDEIGVRNRTELAAWAGRQGLYAAAGERASA